MQAKGAYDQAIGLYEKALAIDTVVFGVNHPKVATMYNNLGVAWDSKGAPVWSVKAVGPVSGVTHHGETFDGLLQLCCPENANMTTCNGMVPAGKPPAAPFGAETRDADGKKAPGFEHPVYFAQYRFVVVDVFEHFGTDDLIKTPVRKRQPEPACGEKVGTATEILGHLELPVTFPGGVQIGQGKVKTDRVHPFVEAGADRVPAFAAPDIENLISRGKVQILEVDRFQAHVKASR